jgi:outer membrane receptor for ferrienterochelin and colicins
MSLQHFPIRSALTGALLLSLATTPALAQSGPSDADRTASTLDTVVVTAAGFEQKITDAPASISVVTRETLSTRPYTNLVDALRDMEGIDVGMQSTDKNGMGTISMRGLPSDYTLVLIDGRRQSNVGDLYPNNFGGGQFSFIPPLDAVERIEVVRGPMSTLYGSDAMGGVINIITRKVADTWTGSVTMAHTFQQDDQFGDDDKMDLFLQGPLVKGLLGLAVRGSWYDREASSPEWPDLPLPSPPNDPGSTWSRTLGFGEGGRTVAATNWNAGFQLSLTPNEDHDITLDYDVSRLKFDNSQGQTGTLDSVESIWRAANAIIPNPNFNPALPAGPGNPATITRRVVQPRVGYTAYQRYEREQVALTHIGRWDIGTSTTSLMHSTSNNLGRSLPLTVEERATVQQLWNAACVAGRAAAYCNNANRANLTAAKRAQLEAMLPRPLRALEIDAWVFDSKLDMALGEHHKTTVGGQFNRAEMEDGVFGMYGDGFRDGTTQLHRQWALFAEDNWSLTDALVFTYGLRHDDHNIFGDHLSPRGYLVWTANEQWTVKGGVSTGYKTPKPNQLFPGITGFGGQGVSPMVGSPDLQPETSTSYEVAAYYDNQDTFSFNATLFLNRFKDKIATGTAIPNCEIAAAGVDCVDIGPGWAALGYSTFSQSTNIDRAETRGVELAAALQLPANFALRGNYTYTKSENKSGGAEGQPISGNPAEHMGNAVLEWRATDALSFNLTAEGRYDRYNAVSVVTGEHLYYKNYTIFHLGGTWRANESLTFNARINNLTDENFISQTCELAITQDAYSCTDDYLIKDQRRNLWVSMNFRF